MRLALSALLFAITAPGYVVAQEAPAPRVTASAPSDVSVTIYRDNLVLVTETRTVDLPDGQARVAFEGVLDNVYPQSAIIRGLEGRERERNFDFDGLSPMRLLYKAIGETVRVVRFNAGNGRAQEEEARIAAAGDGVTLQYANRIEALGCSGHPEKLIFGRIPPELSARPTLSTLVNGAPASKEVTLSYLATGVEWEADYVVTLGADGEGADVRGWITLTNNGAEGFENARVGVVAGDLNRVFSPQTRRAIQNWVGRGCYPLGTTTDNLSSGFAIPAPPPPPPPPPPVAMMAPEAADAVMVTASRRMMAKEAVREELGDYQLYMLPERSSVNARQTKQVAFIAKPEARFERVLQFRFNEPSSDDDETRRSLAVIYRAKNEEANGLGAPLPKGDVRFYAESPQGVLYLGDAQGQDTAVGNEWELRAGETQSVTAHQTILSEKEDALRGDRTRYTYDVEIRFISNSAREERLEVLQGLFGDSLRVRNASIRAGSKYGAPAWFITLQPGEEKTLRYRLSFIN